MVRYILMHEYTYLFMVAEPTSKTHHGWKCDGIPRLSYAYETVFNKQKKLCPIKTIW